MGFGERTGIDLPGEERGLFRSVSEWSKISIGALSMGQEIGVTPLQVATMISAVANGGTLYRPYIVGRIEDPFGHVTAIRPEGRRVLEPGTAADLREALEAVVSDGTARSAQLPGFTAAGKTGTAQKIEPATGSYSRTKYVASFAGFAPARDPEVAVVVVIDEPSGAYHGGEVASPSFRRIAEDILRNRGIVPDSPLPTENVEPSSVPAPVRPRETPEARPDEYEIVDVRNAAEEPEIPVGAIPAPDFRGMTLREFNAECLLLAFDCRSGGSGRAFAQSIAPGAPVVPGQRVEVRFSTSAGTVVGADPDGRR
jgi:membrane peptidoglycan carboxypeptidase